MGLSVSQSHLQEVECPGTGYDLRTALHVELATDIEDVFLYRVHAQNQALGDLAIRCSVYK